MFRRVEKKGKREEEKRRHPHREQVAARKKEGLGASDGKTLPALCKTSVCQIRRREVPQAS